MSIISQLSEHFILPLSDLATGYSIHHHLKFLFKSQYWSREQLDEYQNQKLRQLINHAYTNVPFYHELFLDMGLKPEDIQSKNDLHKLPIVTKDMLKMNKVKNLSGKIAKKDLVYLSSSGSTGEPFQFYSTKEKESINKAAAIRAWYWMGYKLGDKYVKLSMNPRPSYIKKLQDYFNNSLYLSSNQLISEELQRIYKEILSYNPKFVRCYPVPLQFLSREIATISKTYRGNSLVAINTTGSTLQDTVRDEIEKVFGVKIYDSYSCEGGTIFAQCSCSKYYHPAEECAISEFIEDAVTLSDARRPRRHITTDLFNYASPFIRYDTQDYIVLGGENRCDCGRPFINIEQIRGRDSDIIRTPSGKLLIVENFVAYFEWITEVDQIQVIQEEIDKVIIKLVVNVGFTKEIEKNIYTYWTNYIGNDVELIIELVEKLNLTPTGKLRTVIRNPKIRLND